MEHVGAIWADRSNTEETQSATPAFAPQLRADLGGADHPTPRLRRVIAAACAALADAPDRAFRDLLVEVILALGHDQDTRVEMGAEDAARWLEALRQIREFRP